jgi:hypothetical protein
LGREIVPNGRLQRARRSLLSPAGSGRPMSRQELADACNAELSAMAARQGRRPRWAGLTEKTIGALERGEIRWPNDDYRQALCAVLRSDERRLGLYIDRRPHVAGSAVPRDVGLAQRPSGLPVDEDLDRGRHDGQISRQTPNTIDGWRAWLQHDGRGYDLDGPTPTVHTLEDALRQSNIAYQAANYSHLHGLPRLISRAEGLMDSETRDDAIRVASLVSGAYVLASKLASKLGDGPLAGIMADRARSFSLMTADPALTALAAYQTACSLGKQSEALPAAEQTAAAAADTIARHKAHRSPDYLSVRGALLLHAAVTAARQHDARSAWRHLQEAEALANQLGPHHNLRWTGFGPANVALHRISVAVALHDHEDAIRAADQFDSSRLPSALTSRRAQMHLDLATAHGATGHNDPQAVLQLMEFERLAPEAIKINAAAPRLITTLMRRERSSQTPGLRALAHRAGAGQA